MKLRLIPMGGISVDLLTDLSDALAAYGLRCEIEADRLLPQEAFDPSRGQYRAEEVLGRVSGRSGAVLAVTTEDMFAEGLNFVFGLANLGRPGAVVSVHRLRSSDRERFLARVLKEAVHELGHTWGLRHCANAACVMAFSNSVQEADAKGKDFCEVCRRALPIALGLACP